MKWLDTLARLVDGAMDAINRKKKREAANDAANTIANGGSVQQSKKSFSDISGKSDSDSTE